jgi:hypothetical protein
MIRICSRGMTCQQGLACNTALLARQALCAREAHAARGRGAGARRVLPPLCLLDALFLLRTDHRPRDQLQRCLCVTCSRAGGEGR